MAACISDTVMAEIVSYVLNSMVRGYHVYKDIWNSQIDEILQCARERHNVRNQFAVAVKKGTNIVGHLPRSISTASYVFLGKPQSSITCRVVGERRYSRDLPQGGLEIPCQLEFKGEEYTVNKLKKILSETASHSHSSKILQTTGSEPKEKKMKLLDQSDVTVMIKKTWLTFGKQSLDKIQREEIDSRKRLTDEHISFAQTLIKAQFQIVGLQSTLLQNSRSIPGCCLQIVFCRSNHWIVASTIKASKGVVCVYDSHR